MWVIVRWIRNNAYPLTAILLFLFSFNLVLQYQLYQHSFYFNNSISAFRFIDKSRSDFTRYLNLRSENDQLAAENVRLRQMLKVNFVDSAVSFDTTIVDTFSKPAIPHNYTYHNATVVRASTNRKDNYFYLDKGSKQGIENGMAVLSPLGVAGIVVQTSENYARVMSVLHSKFEITPFIEIINLRQGVVKWANSDSRYGNLMEINRTENIKPNQLLTTSNYSAIFPPGIPIAKVDKVIKSDASPYLNIRIKFSTDFSRLDHVYCVKNNNFKEIRSLEPLEKDE